MVPIADNVLLDNGSNPDFTAASDDVGGVQHPFVKLMDGTLGSVEKIGGDAANGLDVDVTRIAPGTGATHLGKAEDGVHTSGDVGVLMLVVRKDTAASTATTDGDYTALTTDSNGRLHVNIGSIPAAARTTDSIASALQTDAIMSGLAALTPQFFSESVTASDTDEELVALTASQKIRVLSLAVQCGATATDITFESSTTTRVHKVPAGANGGQILPFNPVGWFETAAGASLTVTTGTGSTVEISGCYVKVP